jgi:hypothetical protein
VSKDAFCAKVLWWDLRFFFRPMYYIKIDNILEIFENAVDQRMSGQFVKHISGLLVPENFQIFLYILSICRRMLDKIWAGFQCPIAEIRLFY